MRPAPVSNSDETGSWADEQVADPLADSTVELVAQTARKNREIFTEVFRPVPSNLVRDWHAYEVRRRNSNCYPLINASYHTALAHMVMFGPDHVECALC